jgi:hypothetical protein
VEQKLQVYTEKYTKYVIRHLVDIVGKSESDVVNFIIKQWMMDHREDLKEFNIRVKNAKKEGEI